MALSDSMDRLAARTREAEANVKKAQGGTRSKLEAEVEKSKGAAKASTDKLQQQASAAEGDAA